MSKKSFLLGILLGGLIGGLAALFWTPKSGKLMRRDFCDKCKETKHRAGKIVSAVCDETCDLLEKAKDLAHEAKDILSEFKDRR